MNQPISSPLPTDRHISPSAQTVVRPVAEHVASDHRDTGTLGKALTVLSVIAQSPHPMRFTDLLKQVDQPRGTLHRHLSNLVGEGLLRLNHDHTYEPGLRLLTLAANAWSKNSFRVVAEPHMRNLQRQTGETVHLGALNGLEVVYLDKLESNQSVRMHSQVGNASPLYCTGIGKAMLARLAPEEAANRMSQMSFIKHTANTLHTPELLSKGLELIRQRGISHDREEHEPGIFCVAAGIVHGATRDVSGISVTAPSFRIQPDTIERWEHLVRQTANAIENDLAVLMGPRAME